MAGIPQLNSLPSAPNSLYLDFDGHYEPVWHNHYNVNSAAYDRNGKPEFSANEAQDIIKIWNMVADDFAPFNVNVTTIAPTVGDPHALRVVFASQSSAQYFSQGQLKWSVGSNFVMRSDGTQERGSGISFVGSFTNSDPNTAYVFTDTVAQFGRLTPEQIANTASHEAGHAFGLRHHQSRAFLLTNGGPNVNEYETGNGLETPIMGDNLVTGTRHVWSTAPNLLGTQNQVAILTSVLGTRPDDVGGDWSTATPLTLTPSGVDPRTLNAISSVQRWGVISSTSDDDVYRFRTTETGVITIDATPSFEGNLDARLDIFRADTEIRIVNGIRRSFTVQTLVASVDPPNFKSLGVTWGLSATWQGKLPAGNYVVAVKSHGDYGDLGNYHLTVSLQTPTLVNRAASSSSEAAGADLYFAALAAESTPPKKAKSLR